jgi:ferrochelatase
VAGILLLAHGGPSSLEDVPAFLDKVRDGRPCSDELVAEVRERYRAIGGASPLPDITRRTAKKLQEACGLPVYTGMLHWHPFVEETLPQMVLDGISRALVICLVPQYSEAGVGRYHRRTAAAAQELGLPFAFVDSWSTSPPYIAGLAASVAAAQKGLGDAEAAPHVIFTAHSLPKAVVPAGDPYESQLRDTAGRVASALELAGDGWSLAFQSVSGPGRDWLGPSVEQVVTGLSEQGVSHVVLCPFGFLADQVEILYDLDVVLKRKAAEMGVTLARTPLLNDGPAVIDSLSLLVEEWAA